jgi:uncharacterized protein (TIGR02611 family)
MLCQLSYRGSAAARAMIAPVGKETRRAAATDRILIAAAPTSSGSARSLQRVESENARHPWLERLREERERHLGRSRFYRVPFALLGFTVVLVGVALLVLPGPGLLVIAVGLGMLALEFAWAERVLERTLERMTETSSRVRRLGRLEKAVSTLAGVATVGALIAAALYFDIPFLPV